MLMWKHLPALTAACALMSMAAAHAGTATPSKSVGSSFQEWLDGDYFTGDWGGLRTALADKGIDIGLTYYAEIWGNTAGGIQAGAVYTGLGQIETTIDLEKLLGWKDATIFTRWLWLSGQDASSELTGNFFTVSNIAGFNTFRNIELWFQQTWWDERISLRAGQLAADAEFIISTYGSLFINGTFGWPAFVYMDIPNGGPGYPMGAPGIRLSVSPTDSLTILAAVLQGDVFAQNVNRHGFRWRLDANQGFLWLAEAQYQHEWKLPGTIKAGAWFDTGAFSTAANPEDYVWGNYGIYFIVDQMLYQEPSAPQGNDKNPVTSAGGTTPPQGLGAFARIAFEPADRNFLGFYVDGGLSYQGLIPTRDNDTAGVALAYGQLTNGTRDLLADAGEINPNYEMVIEATYLAQITPWLAVQPDAQWIVHPGGSETLGNAFVVGGRVTITF